MKPKKPQISQAQYDKITLGHLGAIRSLSRSNASDELKDIAKEHNEAEWNTHALADRTVGELTEMLEKHPGGSPISGGALARVKAGEKPRYITKKDLDSKKDKENG